MSPRVKSTGLDRTRAPVPGPAPQVRLPSVERFTLAGGLPVLLAARRGVPVVNLQLLVVGGSAALKTGEAGLAALTSDMVDEGSEGRSALEVAASFEKLGAAFHSSAGFDAGEVELNVLAPRLEEALEAFADVVLRPTFPEGELERVRNERLARLAQDLDEPRALATHAFSRVIFGEAHPWGSPLLGTPRTLGRMARADVLRFYQEHYHPGCATLVVAGDVEPDALKALLERTFGTWQRRAWEAPALPQPPPISGPRVYVVDRPGAPQSEIRVGRVAVSRETEDYFPLTVMNTVLGGSFTSRLNSRLREEKGYTYGAGSGFSMRRCPGPFVAQAAVHTPVTDDAVLDFLLEIERMGEDLVGTDELERAKSYIALRLPQRFETVSDVTARLSEVVLYDLPEDYFAGHVDRVMAVTAEDVRAAARKHLPMERMVVVVAGDRSQVQGPLEALGLGPVEALQSPLADGARDGAQAHAEREARKGQGRRR